ncbi:MAG: hypothetical protein GY795_48370 [Desulfobacterales bacterium]|nr:hypothetical protein [Desulfobacterales bacterium]
MSKRHYSTFINGNYKHQLGFIRKMPFVDAIVYNPVTKKDIGKTEKLLVDTGAEVNILHKKYHNLFKDNKILCKRKLKYGASKLIIELPVYEVEFKIKGYIFSTKATIDKNAEYSVVGHDFFNQLDSLHFMHSIKKFYLKKT